ncbi:MAG: 5'/3'-nucleotidase SurE [Candidatus Krumholzibacteria bacterium]|nr:5'/3'-nucleotidase SurE [Candidatus Krumholzibacteria bacterium]
MDEKKTILITNDDGIAAEGLRALSESLAEMGDVIIVAPEQEQSASSHAITLDKPLRIKEISPRRYGVSGTPTDCVLLAIHGILERKPDLIVSGINHGPNMGEDVTYSGTVAAAIEGCILGINSMAISLTSWEPVSFDGAAAAAGRLARVLLDMGRGKARLWNVNVPAIPREAIRGIRVTKLGSRIYNDLIIKKKDPRGRDYFWIGGAEPGWSTEDDTDFAAVSAGYISVTPLRLDFTDYEGIIELEEHRLAWNPEQTTQ